MHFHTGFSNETTPWTIYWGADLSSSSIWATPGRHRRGPSRRTAGVWRTTCSYGLWPIAHQALLYFPQCGGLWENMRVACDRFIRWFGLADCESWRGSTEPRKAYEGYWLFIEKLWQTHMKHSGFIRVYCGILRKYKRNPTDRGRKVEWMMFGIGTAFTLHLIFMNFHYNEEKGISH